MLLLLQVVVCVCAVGGSLVGGIPDNLYQRAQPRSDSHYPGSGYSVKEEPEEGHGSSGGWTPLEPYPAELEGYQGGYSQLGGGYGGQLSDHNQLTGYSDHLAGFSNQLTHGAGYSNQLTHGAGYSNQLTPGSYSHQLTGYSNHVSGDQLAKQLAGFSQLLGMAQKTYPVAYPFPVKEPLPIHIPFPVPVHKTVTVPVEKHVPVPLEKPVPYPVVRNIPVPVPQPYPVPVPVYRTKFIIHGKKDD